MADYYKELGVNKGATVEEIKKSYRKLAKQFHPDRNPDNKEAEARFKKISEAYAVLSDSEKRKQYDMFGASGFSQRYSTEDIFRGTDFGNIFREFDIGGAEDIFSRIFGGAGAGAGGFQGGFGGSPFRGGGFHRQGGGPMKGQDVEYPLQIGFHDAFAGGERQISYQLSDGTKHSFRVKIPAGVNNGGKLRIPEKGAPGFGGGRAGDLLVTITVADHPRFTRVDGDIESPLKLKISEALLGCSKEVETMDGVKKVKIPPGVRPGTKIRLKGLGFPKAGAAGERGDFLNVVDFELPSQLTDRQRAVVTAMQDVDL